MAIERKTLRFSATSHNTTNSSSPADSTFSKKTDLPRLDTEYCHLHRSLFLIEPHREDH